MQEGGSAIWTFVAYLPAVHRGWLSSEILGKDNTIGPLTT